MDEMATLRSAWHEAASECVRLGFDQAWLIESAKADMLLILRSGGNTSHAALLSVADIKALLDALQKALLRNPEGTVRSLKFEYHRARFGVVRNSIKDLVLLLKAVR